MTVAHLGLAVDSGSVSRATPELQKMTAAAGQAEVAADRLKVSTSAGAAAQTSATAATKMHTAALQAQATAARMAGHTSRQLAFQLNDVVVSLAGGMNPAMVALQQGSQISQLGLKEVGNAALGMVRAFAPALAVVGVLTTGFAAMTTEINRTAETQVTLGDVMVASWQLTAEAIMGFMQPAVDWLAGIWDYISPGIDMAMNMLIGSFDLAFRNIGTIWNMLPAALGDVAIQAANGTIKAMEDMINGSLKLLNDFIKEANNLLPEGFKLPTVGEVKFSPFDNPYAGRDKAMASQLNQNAADVRAKTLGGGYTADIGDRAQVVALKRLAEDADDAGKKIKAANDNFGSFLDRVNEGQAVFEETRTPFEDLGIYLGNLDQMLAQGVISWDTYNRAVSMSTAQTAANAAGSLAGLLSAADQAFGGMKELSVAVAVLKGAEAVASAFAEGTKWGGPVLGAVYAGVAFATAAANVATVLGVGPNSKSLSGSGAGAGGAATPAAAAPQAQSSAPSIYLQVKGNARIGVDELETLLGDMAKYLSDSSGSQPFLKVVRS